MSSRNYIHSPKRHDVTISHTRLVVLLIFLICIMFFSWHVYSANKKSERLYIKNATTTDEGVEASSSPMLSQEIDKADYDRRMLALANLSPIKIATTTFVSATSTATTTVMVTVKATSSDGWPVKAVYPNAGALLPFNRIIAYYGNFFSTRMGILGEFEEDVVLQKLQEEVAVWEKADPDTPVIPAIHYIVAVAQADKGSDGDYLARMPFAEIDKAIRMAEKVNGIVFLDIQFGHSTLVEEVEAIKKYLMLPQVHLALDPEFAMQEGKKPGHYIGSLDARDINQAAKMLADIVQEHNLPPKILIVHRFTENMLTNYNNIEPLPEVQVLIEMDGWGSPELKKATYRHVIYDEPVQFAGIKLFYKNDLRPPSTRMLTPEEILDLKPRPIYVQYQ